MKKKDIRRKREKYGQRDRRVKEGNAEMSF